MVCSAYCRFLWIRRYRFQLRPAPYGRFLWSSCLQKPIYENHVCPLCSDDSCFHTARCLGRRKFAGRFAGKSTVRLRIPCGASSGKISFHPHQLRLRRSRRFFPASSRHWRPHRLPGGGTPHLCRHFIRPLPAKHYYHCHGRFLCRQYPRSHYGDAPHSGNDR